MKQIYQPKKVNRIERGDHNRYILEIYAKEPDVQGVEKQVLNQLRRLVSHPGFRKGKTPDRILLGQYGANVREQVVQRMLPILIEQAIKQEELEKVVIGPRVDQLHYQPGQFDLSFEVSFDNQPQVEVKALNDLSLESVKKVHQVTDKEVDAVIEDIRNRQGKMAVKEEFLLNEGDFCLCDVKVTAKDAKVIYHKQSDKVRIQENENIPLFEEKVKEAKQGVELIYKAILTDKHELEHYRGKEVTVQLLLKEALEWQLPEPSNEWAKDLGPYESLEALKKAVKEDIEKRNKQESEQAVQSDIIETFVNAHEFHIPEVIIGQFKEDIMASRYQEIKNYGLKKDQEIEYLRSIEGQVVEQATFFAKRSIVFEALIKEQKLELTEKEESLYIEKRAIYEKKSKEDVLKELTEKGQMDQVKDQLLFEKVVAFLMKHANITEEEVIDQQQEEGVSEEDTGEKLIEKK